MSGGYTEEHIIYSCLDIERWNRGTYFIIISSGQGKIIKEIKEQLLEYGLEEDRDFSVFNKFIEERNACKDISDYFFGYSRDYGQGVNGFKFFTHFSDDKKKKRIIILGGSTSDCGYNSTIINWTSWLEKILYEKGFCVEIWAGGVQGYSSSQELIKLIRDGLLLKPDIVISFSGINDATGLGIVAGHPLVMKSVKYLLKEEKGDIEYGLCNDETPSSIWFMNMKMMQSICDAFNIFFLGILEPFPFYDRRGNLDKFADAFFDEDVQQRIFKFYDEVREKISMERISEKYLIDLSDLFVNRQEMIYDYIHCDTQGNRLIAENIEKYLTQYL